RPRRHGGCRHLTAWPGHGEPPMPRGHAYSRHSPAGGAHVRVTRRRARSAFGCAGSSVPDHTLKPGAERDGGPVPKKIDRSAQIGDAGIALSHRRVNQMGYVWREKSKDAGIDGEIEFRDAVTGEVSNRRLLVQSKASENRFPGETDRSFHYACKDADIGYWMN